MAKGKGPPPLIIGGAGERSMVDVVVVGVPEIMVPVDTSIVGERTCK